MSDKNPNVGGLQGNVNKLHNQMAKDIHDLADWIHRGNAHNHNTLVHLHNTLAGYLNDTGITQAKVDKIHNEIAKQISAAEDYLRPGGPKPKAAPAKDTTAASDRALAHTGGITPPPGSNTTASAAEAKYATPAGNSTSGKTAAPAAAPNTKSSAQGGNFPAGSQAISGGGNTHDFAVDVLKGIGAPVTPSNIQAIMAWSTAESKPGQGAAFNPMNTTQPAAGATNFNPVGVKNYTSYQQGVQATVQTLKNGNYGPILAAFQQGNDPFAVGKAVAASPWGTGQGLLNVLGSGKVGPQPIAGASSTGNYGPPLGGATGSTTTTSGTGNAMLTPNPGATIGRHGYNPQDYEKALQAAGYSAAFINSDPTGSLQQLFKDAVANGYDATEFDHALKNTQWWLSRTDSMRRYDERNLNTAEHKNLAREVEVERKKIMGVGVQMGVQMDPLRAHDLAVKAIRLGLSPEELQQAVAAELHYNPKAVYGGTVGSTINDLNKAAADYYVKPDPNLMGDWAQKIAGGTATLEQYTNLMKQQAATKFPWLADQINAGVTIRDLASFYKQEMGSLLEIDPAAIKDDDTSVMRGLQYMDPANTKGGYSTMPLYQFRDMLRHDPRYEKTDQFRNTATDIAAGVLKDFGLAS